MDGGGVNKIETAGALPLGAVIIVLEYLRSHSYISKCQEKRKEFEMSN